MSPTTFAVCLSSTSTDLAPHRARVRDLVERLCHASICMETFGAMPTGSLEAYKQKVTHADALVVIVGPRYGWVPTAARGGDGHKSITWWEVQWALDAGTPVYAYLWDTNAEWHWTEREQDRLLQAQSSQDRGKVYRAVQGLVDFRSHLESRGTAEWFTSPDDLGGKVATTLQRWLMAEQAKRMAASSDASQDEPPDVVAPPPLLIGSPFPGLRPFTPADTSFFFGRERETDSLVRELCHSSCRLLLVVGAPGSGKSSLVAAGLIPRLAANAIPGSEDWLLPDVACAEGSSWTGLRVRPGELGPDPFQTLAGKLAPLLLDAPRPSDLAHIMRKDPTELAALLQRALAGRSSRAEALLFVDQFEEIITVVTDDGLRVRFVDALISAVQSSRLRVVATIRADFYHRCIDAAPRLADLIRERGAVVPLVEPERSSIREIVEGPARRAGLPFDEGVVDELVDGAAQRPGGLAQLAFALRELWIARTDGRMMGAAREKLGDLTRLVDTIANATVSGLPSAAQAGLDALFGQLVRVDEEGMATRKRAGRGEVTASGDAVQLVEALEHVGLLATDHPTSGTLVVEVAHEALFREWTRLATWISDRADDLRLVHQMRTAARRWDRHERAANFAWPHERLLSVYEALSRLDSAPEAETDPARSFLYAEWDALRVEREEPAPNHQRQVALGGRLGTSRRGVGVTADGLPDLVWCDIPGGMVQLEDGRGMFDFVSFRITKHLITYRQYRTFLTDPGGYRDARHWEGLKHEKEPGQQSRRLDDRPAENVSWYDATAYCRWLSERLGFEVLLPDERQWKQAATGEEKEGPTSADEGRPHQTTAAGSYPDRASRRGVIDLSDNMWEWCRNEYLGPRGSWARLRGYAGAASRFDGALDLRFDIIGFRVVCRAYNDGAPGSTPPRR